MSWMKMRVKRTGMRNHHFVTNERRRREVPLEVEHRLTLDNKKERIWMKM